MTTQQTSMTMNARVDGIVDGDVTITDNTVHVDAGEGRARLHLNGVDITGMINPGWSLVHSGGDQPEATLTVTFPVRVLGSTPPASPCKECGEPIQPGQECHRGHGCLQDPVLFPPPAEVND